MSAAHRRPGPGSLALPAFALLLSGFASLTYQIVWVRRFAVVLGTTNAAVTLVLAMFLGGLGLGALLAGRSGGPYTVERGRRTVLRLRAATPHEVEGRQPNPNSAHLSSGKDHGLISSAVRPSASQSWR